MRACVYDLPNIENGNHQYESKENNNNNNKQNNLYHFLFGDNHA